MSEDPTTPIHDVIARARQAQIAWAQRPVSERAARLRPLGPRALARADRIAHELHEELGKPTTEALLAEVLTIADLTDYWTHRIENLLEPEIIAPDPLLFPGKTGHVQRVPRGVIALITPYSFPVIIPLQHIIPALLAGNAVVFKPSEHTPRASAIVLSLFENLLPANLLQLVEGGPEAGQAILTSGVDALAFTGSTRAGRRVAVACAQQLLPCSLKLAGNDPAIVLADANIERTAQGIVWGAFNNAGQNCASIQRVYVVRAAADALTQRIVDVTRSLQPGRDIGPISTQPNSDAAAKQLADAVAQGAEVLTGGAPEPGSRAFPPTVLRVEDPTIDLLRSETLAPILPIVVVEDEEQAFAYANDSAHGLTASVWSRRIRRAKTLAHRLRAGVVTINNHGFTASLPMAPWSGVGDSGYGVTNSPYALESYTRPRLLVSDRRRASREPWWYPYSDTLESLAIQTARMRGGAGFFGRIAAFFALLVLLPKRLLGK